MIGAAELETRLRTGEFGVIAAAYLHRAKRETSLGVVTGRDRLLDSSIVEAALAPNAALTLGLCAQDLATFRIDNGAAGWHGHRWLWREGDRIVGETVIEDGVARAAAIGQALAAPAALAPIHSPLGELRPGQGQFAAGDSAIVPPDWPAAALTAADRMHRIWNGRAIDELKRRWHPQVAWRGPDGRHGDRDSLAQWLTTLFAAFPDVTLMFERAIVTADVTALLWRLHGHHHGPGFGVPTGRRIRLIGSTVLQISDGQVISDDTLIDTLALSHQLATPPIAWRAIAVSVDDD